jgi:hypothetical protein
MGFRVSEMGQLKDRPLDNSMCTDPVQHQAVHFRKRHNLVQGPPAFPHRDIPISFCRLNATQQRPSAFSPRLWAERTIRRAEGHQHRQARRLSTSHRAAPSRGGSEGESPASTGAISQQRSGTGSSGDQAPDTRKPAFSLVLGSLAHNCGLRDDAYDPQSPSVLECGECEGRSTAPLHC